MVLLFQVPTPDAKLAARGYQIDLHHRFSCVSSSQCNGGESCIMTENGLTRNIVAKFLQCSLLLVCDFCAASEERYERGYGRVCTKL